MPTHVVDKQQHPQPQQYHNPLAGNPPGGPRFGVEIERADGSRHTVSDPRANRIALALMDFEATLGGAACHWGGPAAYAEIMSAIHGIMYDAEDWRDAYHFVNDTGHTENGIYALKANYGFAGLDYDSLKGFRSMESPLTGHGETQCWPEGVMISNGPLGSGIGVAQGLAMADAMAGWDRVTICTLSDGATFEGEAREALAAIPGFAQRDELAPFVLVISHNDTKMCGRITEDSYDMAPTYRSLEAQGWKVVEVKDGHDLQAVYSAVEDAVASVMADRTRPVAVWCHTIKGKGVKSAEENKTGGHGYPVKDAKTLRAFVEELAGGALDEPLFADWLADLERRFAEKQAAKKSPGGGVETDKIQSGLAQAAIEAVERGLPVVNVSADLQTSTMMVEFHKAHPERVRDVGIAESNMISAAAGFSKLGYVPIVDTFAQFGTSKGALPLVMGQISGAGVICVFTHIGFQDAADGASHQSVQYLGLVSSIPHVDVYCPACKDEARWAMEQAIERHLADRQAGRAPRTVVFFCGREPSPVVLKREDQRYRWGEAMVLKDTSKDHDHSVVISANASMVQYAYQAVDLMAEQGIGAVLLNNSTPNHPDVEGHRAALERCGNRLVSVEDHRRVGGAGSMLAAHLLEAGVCPKIKILGIEDDFGRSAYKAVELYDHHGMGPKGITAAARSLIG